MKNYARLFRQRLYNQRLAGTRLKRPEDVVRWLGAVQAQDYAAAKWAIAQRSTDATDAAIERAFNDGSILRTHVLRPTWHFVAPDDIRWMLNLTAPRVKTVSASFYRQWRLDDRLCAKSNAVLAAALRGGTHLSRAALAAALRRARILKASDDSLRFIGLLMRAELDAVICSGPREGRQFTYALLEERVPRSRDLTGDEAGAELARRYFVSHGPATLKDFVWWSGLKTADARAALESCRPGFASLVVGGETYWHSPDMPDAGPVTGAYLFGTWEEVLLSYRDTRAAIPGLMRQSNAQGGQLIVLGGRPIGSWRTRWLAGSVVVEATLTTAAGRREARAVERAVEAYGRFLERSASVTFTRTPAARKTQRVMTARSRPSRD